MRKALGIGLEDRAAARYNGDDLGTAAGRRERAGEAAAILFVDCQRKGNGAKLRFLSRCAGMMRVSSAQNDGFALTFPGAAQVWDGGLR